MRAEAWHRYFLMNQERPYAAVPPVAPPMTSDLKRALARSMEMFRVGETGEGRIVNDVRVRGGVWTSPLCEALALYIREEGQHARLLGDIVLALRGARGGSEATARHHLGTRGFVVVRRAAGVDTKMVVLFAVEVVGIVFYELVAERLAPCGMRDALLRMASDERAHLLFQRDYFTALARASRLPLASAAYAAAVLGATAGAVAAFAATHHDTLAGLGVSLADIGARVRLTLREALEHPEGPPRSSSRGGARARNPLADPAP